MQARVTAAEVDGVIRRLLRGARVRAAARVEVRAEAARGVQRARARVSVREAARVIVRDRVGAAISTVIHRAKATVAVPGTNTRRVRAAEAIRPYLNPAKAVQVLPASRLIRRLLGRERKRRANRISQNTRIRKILDRFNRMILIAGGRRR